MNNCYIRVGNTKAKQFLDQQGFVFKLGIKNYYAGYSPDEKPCATAEVWYCTNANMSGKAWNKFLRDNNLLMKVAVKQNK